MHKTAMAEAYCEAHRDLKSHEVGVAEVARDYGELVASEFEGLQLAAVDAAYEVAVARSMELQSAEDLLAAISEADAGALARACGRHGPAQPEAWESAVAWDPSAGGDSPFGPAPGCESPSSARDRAGIGGGRYSEAQVRAQVDCMSAAIPRRGACGRAEQDPPEGGECECTHCSCSGEDGGSGEAASRDEEPSGDAADTDSDTQEEEALERARIERIRAQTQIRRGTNQKDTGAHVGGAGIGLITIGGGLAASSAATGPAAPLLLAAGGVVALVGGIMYVVGDREVDRGHVREEAARVEIVRNGGNAEYCFESSAAMNVTTEPVPMGKPAAGLDIARQCNCNAMTASNKHTLGPDGRCESKATGRAECMINPLGPDDRPRPACAQFLVADEGIGRSAANAVVCAAAMCLDGTRPANVNGRCVCASVGGVSGAVDNPIERLQANCRATIQCHGGAVAEYGELGCSCSR